MAGCVKNSSRIGTYIFRHALPTANTRRAKRSKQFAIASNVHFDDCLHLAVSMRSFRAENVSAFVKALLDCDRGSARMLFVNLDSTDTRSRHARSSSRQGMGPESRREVRTIWLVASSKAQRLKPHAIDIRVDIDPVHWFLNDRTTRVRATTRRCGDGIPGSRTRTRLDMRHLGRRLELYRFRLEPSRLSREEMAEHKKCRQPGLSAERLSGPVDSGSAGNGDVRSPWRSE